jgi:Methyltransferase domain
MHQYAPQLRQDHRRPIRSVAQLLAAAGSIQHGALTWYDIGIGWYPVSAGIKPYDRAYFERYHRQANSDIGRALMAARLAFVRRHWWGPGMLADVGIGCGAFIELCNRTKKTAIGYDVNPAGIEWLKQHRCWFDPYRSGRRISVLTLWDVLEHMPDFSSLLARVDQWVFVSLPIFGDAAHVLHSKHFRPDEHCWYFSRDGLVTVMQWLGFELIEETDMETRIGREDIGAFAFRRN